MGAITWVERSPLKATVPVVVTLAVYVCGSTFATWIRERCAVSSSTVPTCPAEVVTLSPESFPRALPRVPPPHAVTVTAASRQAAPSAGLVIMGLSGLERIQRSRGRALQLRAGVVGGRQRVGVLALGVEQILPCVEQLQGGRPAEAIADGCDVVGLAGERQQLIADVDGLAERRGRRRVRSPEVLAHLALEVAVGGRELELAVPRLADLTVRVLPVEEGNRKRHPGEQHAWAGVGVVAGHPDGEVGE